MATEDCSENVMIITGKLVEAINHWMNRREGERKRE